MPKEFCDAQKTRKWSLTNNLKVEFLDGMDKGEGYERLEKVRK